MSMNLISINEDLKSMTKNNTDNEKGGFYETFLHDRFLRIIYEGDNVNRDISEYWINILSERMRDYGWDHSSVVKVYESESETVIINGKRYPVLYVIDGQHRVEAAKRTNTPITYTIIDTPTIESVVSEIVESNIARKMVLEEYLKMWVKVGKSSYIYIQDHMNRYDLKLSIILKLMGLYNNYHKEFSAGRIFVSEERRLDFEQSLFKFQELRLIDPEWSIKDKSPFLMATADIVRDKRYEHNRMMNNMERMSGVLTEGELTNSKDFKIRYNKVFNWHRPIEKHVDFTKSVERFRMRDQRTEG